ncbi:hypothetical protein Golomagni_06479 [Golovinomyces magnicellulatus]|nr:hypothetical protein Golomagni_06479 [Golovinomyces magnicellulatus]
MATPPSVFHAYLRPVMLQVLRSTGYHSTRPNVLDSLTDLAARYMAVLCEKTANHAAHNHGDSGDFTIEDIRLALQDTGALLPDRVTTEEMFSDQEDTRGVEDFIAWFSGQRMKELMEVGNADGESDATDYLNALKKKHNKTGDDAKYNSTILGRGAQGPEVTVEGGETGTINEWISQRMSKSQANPIRDDASSPASSDLSSVGGRLQDDDIEMDLS